MQTSVVLHFLGQRSGLVTLLSLWHSPLKLIENIALFWHRYRHVEISFTPGDIDTESVAIRGTRKADTRITVVAGMMHISENDGLVGIQGINCVWREHNNTMYDMIHLMVPVETAQRAFHFCVGQLQAPVGLDGFTAVFLAPRPPSFARWTCTMLTAAALQQMGMLIDLNAAALSIDELYLYVSLLRARRPLNRTAFATQLLHNLDT